MFYIEQYQIILLRLSTHENIFKSELEGFLIVANT